MNMSTILGALFGAHVIIKKVNPLEPFKRSLELERVQEVKAAAELQDAIRDLVKAVEEKRDDSKT